MKNQYFGDIGDYKKYSILRRFAIQGSLKVLICWMLTEDDGRTDGRFIQYLSSPIIWRSYDATVFDFLSNLVLREGKRQVSIVEEQGLIPNATFFSNILSDDEVKREQYFTQLFSIAKNADIVFLDPDNGIEVPSAKYGKKGSSKYLYWNELTSLYDRGLTLLVYQHFSRKERDRFIRNLAIEMLKQTSSQIVISIKTSHSVYFLIPNTEHLLAIDKAIKSLVNAWHSELSIVKHRLSNVENILSVTQLGLFD